MKILAFLAAVMLSLSAAGQRAADYDVSTDKENGSTVYKGEFSFAELRKDKSFGWFSKGESEYKPDSAAVAYLRRHLPGYDLVVIMGTWCDDSQNLIPKLSKTLTAAQYPAGQLRLYGVDRAKTAKYVEHRTYRVEKVPVIILFKSNQEVGRITETVRKSIEADLLELVKKQEDAEANGR